MTFWNFPPNLHWFNWEERQFVLPFLFTKEISNIPDFLYFVWKNNR